MDLQNVFQISQLRYEVATARAIEHWQPGHKEYGYSCPHCGAKNYKKYSVENGTQRYRCEDCQRRFNQRPKFICNCEVPGKLTTCHDCPAMGEFLEVLKTHTKELRPLGLAELEQLRAEQEA
jgi:predicted RNA-binding Zn-ribbon protein involved in translation (DUF1610 family)